MPIANHRLTTLEVARFVAEGYLRFDALVAAVLNDRVIEELARISEVKIPQAVGVVPKAEIEGRPASRIPAAKRVGCTKFDSTHASRKFACGTPTIGTTPTTT